MEYIKDIDRECNYCKKFTNKWTTRPSQEGLTLEILEELFHIFL